MIRLVAVTLPVERPKLLGYVRDIDKLQAYTSEPLARAQPGEDMAELERATAPTKAAN
jgi:hypothetical protein